MFWVERVNLPEDDLAAEWDVYLTQAAAVDTVTERRTAEALARFDRELAPLEEAEAAGRVAADETYWLPRSAARERYAPLQERAEPDDMTAEERLELAIAGLVRRHPSIWDLAQERRDAARWAAWDRDYAEWKRVQGSEHPLAGAREAVERVRRDRPEVQDWFHLRWGLRLPECIFTFWAFVRALGPEERKAFADLELSPAGIMDLFDDPGLRDRPDALMRLRDYRDPPEFVTFMRGDADGLHFGLWFDDGSTCDGVVGYYSGDGGGMGVPTGTPLQEVRERLEYAWFHLWQQDTGPAQPVDPRIAEHSFRLRLLRETVMAFETDDVPEWGDEYHSACWDRLPEELREHGDRRRITTLDGAGALVEGETVLSRGPQPLWDDHDFCVGLERRLIGDPAAVATMVADATRRCSAGDPAEALVLGRDLHWLGRNDPARERQANELLIMAYHALDRPNLAAIAEAHHHRRTASRTHATAAD